MISLFFFLKIPVRKLLMTGHIVAAASAHDLYNSKLTDKQIDRLNLFV